MSEYEYKLSVVVLVYNTEYYLKECLDSLVNQTLKDIEIICVNDESTDNSLNILKQYAKKYDNIKIINQKNQGGANAGNNGLKIAKGEYVTLVDSDDILVEDAYEKLYNKAKETDSDIVGGKPNIYMSGYQRELFHKNNIWLKERTINPKEDFIIYYDVFYWNKIYKRELIEKHNIYMIPNKLYADVPLVFKAYLYANKITTIPDFIYYWRKRSNSAITKGNTYTSMSTALLNIDNMVDRLSTYYYLKSYFKEAKQEQNFNTCIKTYLERFFYPINGILNDETFKKEYVKEIYAILKDIENIEENNLSINYRLYTYFILNKQINTLEDFLLFNKDNKDTIYEDGKTYWNLKYFRNPDYNIPDELFEITDIDGKFINIESMNIDSKFIHINNIEIAKNIKIDECNLILVGLTKKYQSRKENIYKFSLEANENNISAKVPIKKIKNINIYDVYLNFKYEGKNELVRIRENNFENIDLTKSTQNKKLRPHFTKLGNLSLTNASAKNLFKISANKKGMKITPNNKGDINYKIFINYKRNSERVYFIRKKDKENKPKNELELEWEYSLDKSIPYTLYLEISHKKYKLTDKYFKNFKNQEINYNNQKIKLFKDTDNSISVILK